MTSGGLFWVFGSDVSDGIGSIGGIGRISIGSIGLIRGINGSFRSIRSIRSAIQPIRNPSDSGGLFAVVIGFACFCRIGFCDGVWRYDGVWFAGGKGPVAIAVRSHRL